MATGWDEGEALQETGKYLMVSCLSLLLWEHSITFTREASFILHTGAPFIIKALSLFTRYFTLIAYISRFVILFAIDIPLERCPDLLTFQTWAGFLILAAAELLITWRVWQLCDHNRTAGRMVGGLYLGSFLVCVGLLATGPGSVVGGSSTRCSFTRSSHHMYLFLILLIAQTFLFAMTLWSAHHRAKGSTKISFIRALYNQGAMNHLMIFMAIILDLVVPSVTSISQPTASSSFLIAVISLSSSRLLISTHIDDAPLEQDIPPPKYCEGSMNKRKIQREDIVVIDHRSSVEDIESPSPVPTRSSFNIAQIICVDNLHGGGVSETRAGVWDDP